MGGGFSMGKFSSPQAEHVATLARQLRDVLDAVAHAGPSSSPALMISAASLGVLVADQLIDAVAAL